MADDDRAPLLRWTTMVRSKNAGPFTLTIDVVFRDHHGWQLARESADFRPERLRELLGVDQLELYWYEAGNALKVTFPRSTPSGALGDHDVYGGQGYAPLLSIDLGLPPGL